MTTDIEIAAWLAKAQESLMTAESEFVNARYNSCANRCYYAAFQAAIAALLQAGMRPREPQGAWGHAFVQAQFAGELVNRRKRYPADFRDTLVSLHALRRTADYEAAPVNPTRVSRALRQAREMVRSIDEGRR